MTAEDLLVHCSADDNEDKFLNAELSDIQLHFDHISDCGLVDTLKHGMGHLPIWGDSGSHCVQGMWSGFIFIV
jgi:hypothetical protein